MNLFPTLTAVALYATGATVIWRRMRAPRHPHGAGLAVLWVLAALAAHAVVLFPALWHGGALDLGFVNAISAVAWVVIGLYALTALVQPIESLGVLLLPVGALAVALNGFWPHPRQLLGVHSTLYAAHIVISLLAYALLSIAVAQSLMHAAQEKALRRHTPAPWLRALPPLETMERLMFGMIWIGFALLTATLVSGVFFSEEIFGRPLRFTHHTVLSIIAWIVFAILLAGRVAMGWRGRVAMRLALGGFTALALAYFGAKFVLELLLGR